MLSSLCSGKNLSCSILKELQLCNALLGQSYEKTITAMSASAGVSPPQSLQLQYFSTLEVSQICCSLKHVYFALFVSPSS